MNTKELKSQDDWTIFGHGDYGTSVVNALARALGRLELVDEWAGVDHDMPGTTQEEREASRWAAKQLLDELAKELADSAEVTATNGRGGRAMLTVGPFKSLRETTPRSEQEGRWAEPEGRATGERRPRLYMMSEKRASELRDAAYHSRLWDPKEGTMSDAELARDMFGWHPTDGPAEEVVN